MIELLIIADDFTGALDTGVMFAQEGADTKVVTGENREIDRKEGSPLEVLVVDAETRHLPADEAYRTVYRIIKRAKNAGVGCIFKKTDSALRGNIGSELAAALEASGETRLHFIPAFPRMNRITVKGIHYIDGVPVKESVFGQDPFDPVSGSCVADIIKSQSSLPVTEMWKDEIPKEEKTIVLYDADCQERLEEIGTQLKKDGGLRVVAGCAGLASALPALLGLGGRKQELPEMKPNFLVMCGSVNPVTKKQLDYACSHGFTRIRLTPEEKLDHEYLTGPEGEAAICGWMKQLEESGRCIIDTNDLPQGIRTMDYADEHNIDKDRMREEIASNLGYILKRFLENGANCTVMITGGDSLKGFMDQIHVNEIIPLCELEPGIVLSRFRLDGEEHEIISKSGGFGGETLLVDLAERFAALRKKNEPRFSAD